MYHTCRNTCNDSIIRYITDHNSTGSHHYVIADMDPLYNRCSGAYPRSGAHSHIATQSAMRCNVHKITHNALMVNTRTGVNNAMRSDASISVYYSPRHHHCATTHRN